MIKSAIKKMVSLTGYTIYKNGYLPFNNHSYDSMEMGLQRLKHLGISPGTVIDLGAAQGTWTEKALSVWPNAKYELVEPLSEQTAVLEKLKTAYPNISHHLSVAGESKGEVFLNVSSDLDGSGVYGEESANARRVPVTTIDEMVRNKTGDILIKFDTHGYEVPILKGAVEALKRTSALIIEVYGFRLSPTCLVFHELSAYLDGLGFRLVDMVDIMRRPGDQVFWQADAFYLRKDNPVFEKNTYA